MQIPKPLASFFNSEKTPGLLLLFCTLLSMVIANTAFGKNYVHFWHLNVLWKPIEFWINDGLMTIFFLLIGLEMKRELYTGELSSLQKAMLPLIAAVGGMIVPAFIYFLFNKGTATQNGFGIPMATDIAFSLGILSLLGNKVPASLKVFLTALAIIDDLGAILLIAVFYSLHISFFYLGIAALLFLLMMLFNKLKVNKVWVYLLLGCGLWFCMYRSGVHATITGVLLAFVIPFGNGNSSSLSHRLEYLLHKPVSFFILPLFALANTAIVIPHSFSNELFTVNSLGIMLGLLVGKPVGIFLFSMTGIATGLCLLPGDIKRKDLFGVGILAGIGFTMSIFITLLAFTDAATIDSSKIAIILVSVLAETIGFLWLRSTLTIPDSHRLIV